MTITKGKCMDIGIIVQLHKALEDDNYTEEMHGYWYYRPATQSTGG